MTRQLRIECLETRALLSAVAFDYLIVTSAGLEDSFQPLAQQKRDAGMSAIIATTEYIYAEYSGTETGDNADRIRQFIAEAHNDWGVAWVLLGGDSEIIPPRLVYGSAYSQETLIATDLYYASLDGPWNSDGDNLWGEGTDGEGGGDIDLIADVYVGRAPVSNTREAGNFVAKTIQYATQSHTNYDSMALLGSRLDNGTWGSYSSIAIREQVLPEEWRYVELYDSVSTWDSGMLAAELNANTHLVNHLGHSGSSYSAKLSGYTVNALTNTDPYILYSQGCWAGAFDLADVAIAEAHVVAEHGAVAVIMNSRLGWYAPGPNPGGSHYYALEFWDAIFNEGKTTLGEAHWDSRLDNLFRVQATGVYRWINFETNLFGDPSLQVQLDPPILETIADQSIDGTVSITLNASGGDGPLTYSATAISAGDIVSQLDDDLGLRVAREDHYFDYRGVSEKYLTTPGDAWYFLLPDGSLYSWGGSIEASTFMVVIGQQYYDNPALLASASTAELARQLDGDLGLYVARPDHYVNHRGYGEKYFLGPDNAWFYILPNGEFYRWGGSIADSGLVGKLDTEYYADPTLLLDATSADMAYSLGLRLARPDHYFDYRGLGEKYFRGNGGSWYYILPDGRLYHWAGSVEESTLAARLGVAYYDDPSMLLDAPGPPVALQDAITVGVVGNTLTISIVDQAIGGFSIEASVTDGRLTDSKTFRVEA